MFLEVEERGRWEEVFDGRVLLGCSGGFFVGRLLGYGSFCYRISRRYAWALLMSLKKFEASSVFFSRHFAPMLVRVVCS